MRKDDLNFENFVSLECSMDAGRKAFAFTHANASNPALLIHGATGLGKTQLLNAVAQTHKNRVPPCLVNGERFERELQQCIDADRLEFFRSKYRHVELLLLDELQYFAGKEVLELELLATLRALERRGRRMMICSNLHPAKILGLSQQLKDWIFDHCDEAELFAPGVDDRLVFAKYFAESSGRRMEQSVLEDLAGLPSSNFFELIGRLNRVWFDLSLEPSAAPTR